MGRLGISPGGAGTMYQSDLLSSYCSSPGFDSGPGPLLHAFSPVFLYGHYQINWKRQKKNKKKTKG